MHLNLVTAPAVEPVALETLKQHLRMDSDAEDALLETYIEAARMRVEGGTCRQLVGATWELVLDAFPCGDVIELPKPPLRSVTSVKYLDPDGTQQTWSSANYRTSAPTGSHCGPGSISLALNTTWPVTQAVRNAVTIRFIAGYCAPDADQATAAAAVPGPLRAALLLTAAELYRTREDAGDGTRPTVPLCARSLWFPFWLPGLA